MVTWTQEFSYDFKSLLVPLVQDVGTCVRVTDESFTGTGGSVGMTTALSVAKNRARVKLMLPSFDEYVLATAWFKAHTNMTRVMIRELLQYKLNGTQKKYAGFGFDYTDDMWEVLRDSESSPETYYPLTTPSPFGTDALFTNNPPTNGAWFAFSVLFRRGATVAAQLISPYFGSTGKGIIGPAYYEWALSSYAGIDHTSVDNEAMTQIEFEGQTLNAAEQFHLGKLEVKFGEA